MPHGVSTAGRSSLPSPARRASVRCSSGCSSAPIAARRRRGPSTKRRRSSAPAAAGHCAAYRSGPPPCSNARPAPARGSTRRRSLSSCANREERGAIAAMAGVATLERAASTGGPVHYLPCPTCKTFMNRQNFGHVSGVIVDVCKGHGVWFDRGELQAVMTFIDTGGLERARAHDAQKLEDQHQLEHLRESGSPSSVQSASI